MSARKGSGDEFDRDRDEYCGGEVFPAAADEVVRGELAERRDAGRAGQQEAVRRQQDCSENGLSCHI